MRRSTPMQQRSPRIVRRPLAPAGAGDHQMKTALHVEADDCRYAGRGRGRSPNVLLGGLWPVLGLAPAGAHASRMGPCIGILSRGLRKMCGREPGWYKRQAASGMGRGEQGRRNVRMGKRKAGRGNWKRGRRKRERASKEIRLLQVSWRMRDNGVSREPAIVRLALGFTVHVLDIYGTSNLGGDRRTRSLHLRQKSLRIFTASSRCAHRLSTALQKVLRAAPHILREHHDEVASRRFRAHLVLRRRRCRSNVKLTCFHVDWGYIRLFGGVPSIWCFLG